MKADPKDILDKIQDEEYLRAFIDNSRKLTATFDINQTRVAGRIVAGENN